MSDDPVIVCDLDGVLWRGETAVAGSAAAVAALRAAGRRVAFLTNNSSHRVQGVVDRLANIGVVAAADDVLSSAQAAASLLAADLAPGARILTCAGPGVVEALTAAGYQCVDAGSERGADEPCAAVVVGFHLEF